MQRTPRSAGPTLAAWLAASLLAAGCTPGSGAVRLDAAAGRVADRESGAPIAEADVYQVYWGRGVAGEPRPAYAIRQTRSDAAGAFRFDEGVSSEPRSWVLETDEAEYAFFHPEYGLVRAGPAPDAAPLVLAGSRLDTARRRFELRSLCGSRPPDALVREVTRSHCPHTQR